MMLDAVYIDMTTKELVGLKPKAAFLPLFNLGEPVTAGDHVLTTNLTAAGVDSTPSLPITAASGHIMVLKNVSTTRIEIG